MQVVALAGGVGAARFLAGLVRVIDPGGLTVVANTGDDVVMHGLSVSPDLDTICYTLGGGADVDRGWGRAGETFAVATELRDRYGRADWFTLGDRDIATHLVRSQVRSDGGTLSDATAEIARAWGLSFRLLPMTDDPAATRIRVTDGRELGFQEWWVREGTKPDVAEVVLDAAGRARPAPGVLPALQGADVVLVCPSNPVVSIGPILAVPGIRSALRSPPVVGVSPIIGGRVVRGMAHRLLPAVGAQTSAAAVAGLYADFLDGWVIDHEDADAAGGLGEKGLRVAVTDTRMRGPEVAAALARTALALASGDSGASP